MSVKEVDREGFVQETAEGTVVVDFWGPRCAPCLALMPVVEELASQLEGKVRFLKVDSSKNRRLCVDLGVMSLPTFLAYRDGQEVERLTGHVDARSLREMVQRL
ncbi:MAG: thioredoxin family protein [Bacillota bacterium]